MTGGTKTVGLILMIAGAIVGVLVVGWLAANLAEDDNSMRVSGAVFGGVVLFAVVVAPLAGGGLFLFTRGRAEEQRFAHVGRQRKMLGIVEAAGEIEIADLALQLGGTRDSVRTDLYDLVSKGLFTGYVNWDRGILYARQASELRDRGTCPNCGGALSLAGKGLIRCEFCGAEIFLP